MNVVARAVSICALTLGIALSGFGSGLVFAQSDTAESRRVNTQNAAAGAEVLINQVDTSAFPKVSIFATVLRDGQPVDKLTANDFRVREDEVDQEPLTVTPKLAALNAVITVDTSGSIKKNLPDVQAAASGFIDNLGTEDRFSVIGFAREVKVLSSSGDRTQAKTAIASTVARGDTALYDAIYESVAKLKDVKGRKAVILLSDGVDDNGEGKQLSKHSLDDGLSLAKQVNVPVYTVGLGAEIDESVLKKVAVDTGAKFFLAPKSSDLKQLYDNIGRQLLGQYSIEYSSNLPADGSIHNVKLSQGSAFGSKEYVSPGTASATTVSTPIKETTVVSAVAKLPPGLHVWAIPSEGAEPIKVDNFRLFPDNSQFDEPKAVASSDYNIVKWSTPVPPGKYIVHLKRGVFEMDSKVEVPEGSGVQLVMNMNVGNLQLIAKMNEGGEKVKVDRFQLLHIAADGTEKSYNTEYNAENWTTMVPAGKIKIRATRGTATTEKEVEIVAGKTQQEAMIFGAGALSAIAVLVDGGEKLKVDRFTLSTIDNGFGDSKVVGTQYNTPLWKESVSQGKYRLTAKVGMAEVSKDIEISSGGVHNEVIVLNAGGLDLIATESQGSPRLKVEKLYIKEKGNNFDEPKVLGSEYSSDHLSTVLPAGDYTAGVKVNGSEREISIHIEAGKKLQQEIVLGAK